MAPPNEDVGTLAAQIGHLGQRLDERVEEMKDMAREGFAGVHVRLDGQGQDIRDIRSEVRVQNGRIGTIEEERRTELAVEKDRAERRSGWKLDLNRVIAILAFLAVFVPTIFELAR